MMPADSLQLLESISYLTFAAMMIGCSLCLFLYFLIKTLKTLGTDLIEILTHWIMVKQDSNLRQLLIDQYIDQLDMGHVVELPSPPALPPSQQSLIDKKNQGTLF